MFSPSFHCKNLAYYYGLWLYIFIFFSLDSPEYVPEASLFLKEIC